jgi:hypothetical protein
VNEATPMVPFAASIANSKDMVFSCNVYCINQSKTSNCKLTQFQKQINVAWQQK